MASQSHIANPQRFSELVPSNDPTLGWAVILHPREDAPEPEDSTERNFERHRRLDSFFPCPRKAQKIEGQMAGEQV